MRKHAFVIGEYYHIYNRGVDKRDIILDKQDLDRFIESCTCFNNTESIGSIYELSFKNRLGSPTSKLASVICFCINHNHFHLLLKPLVENGIEKFMQKLGGYTKYFNEKYDRTGSLFQGKFKSKHIKDNEYLLHVSAYINMNNRDILGSPTSKLSHSTYDDYCNISNSCKLICEKNIILDQFSGEKPYSDFAMKSWLITQEIKAQNKKDFNFLPESIVW